MSAAYCRMVLRVHPDLPARLATIQELLLRETLIEYSFAAIMRGLIALGLNHIDGAPCLALLFEGARVKRGRKPGGKVPTGVVPFDLTQGDMDLEPEDIHNDALGPQPKREVVARRRTRRRRSPIRDAGLLEPKPPKRDEEDDEYEDDEDTDPGMDLDDADTADEEPDGL